MNDLAVLLLGETRCCSILGFKRLSFDGVGLKVSCEDCSCKVIKSLSNYKVKTDLRQILKTKKE